MQRRRGAFLLVLDGGNRPTRTDSTDYTERERPVRAIRGVRVC